LLPLVGSHSQELSLPGLIDGQKILKGSKKKSKPGTQAIESETHTQSEKP
jgi:hypothetical protein